jgi:hypothetical protein
MKHNFYLDGNSGISGFLSRYPPSETSFCAETLCYAKAYLFLVMKETRYQSFAPAVTFVLPKKLDVNK